MKPSQVFIGVARTLIGAATRVAALKSAAGTFWIAGHMGIMLMLT